MVFVVVVVALFPFLVMVVLKGELYPWWERGNFRMKLALAVDPPRTDEDFHS